MKGIVSILALGFALSMCNLTKRTNTNRGNTNTGNSESSSSPRTELLLPEKNQNSGVKSSSTAPVSGGLLNGKAISMPAPAYPPIAKTAHASGQVIVQVLVDENGNVLTAHAISGHPLLHAAAVAAARQARFTPMKLSGQPVKVTGTLTYNFVAQ